MPERGDCKYQDRCGNRGPVNEEQLCEVCAGVVEKVPPVDVNQCELYEACRH